MRKTAARASRWPRPSTSCAASVTCARSTISARCRPACSRTAAPCCCAMSPSCASARPSRNGIAELDGEGEVVGGIVVMRDGENAKAVIDAVKTRLEQVKSRLPQGVEIVTTYDRSALIARAREQPQRQAGRGAAAGVAGLRAVPVACALGAGRDLSLPLGRAGRARDHALAGPERKHHVARRHRHRHWRDGRRRGGDDRERARASGAPCARAWRRGRRSRPRAGDRRERGRGRSGVVLLAADHRALVPAGVPARSPGGTHVRAAGLDQDLGADRSPRCCRSPWCRC